MTVVAIDASGLRVGGRGIARSIRHLTPLLVEQRGLHYVILLTSEGARLLEDCPGEKRIVPTMPTSVWEQIGLPWFARRAGASMIYSLAECAPLWGPMVFLHVPEDPYIRWELMPALSFREHLRRVYQRLTMTAGIRRAALVAAPCETTADALRARFQDHIGELIVVPLGVDSELFRASDAPKEDAIFHLGSSEARDQSAAVVRAYSEALSNCPDLPDLVIGGDLGPNFELVRNVATQTGIASRLRLLGRVRDVELRDRYANCAVCVQPARYEGFGLQPLEALSCGAPLVVQAEGAVLEVVDGAALVLEDDDPNSLANAIVNLWNDPGRRKELRAAGPERAAAFRWSTTALGIHRTLERLSSR